ncbi:MAG: non-ribosomal peptide synthetase, partial [Chloroflexi bacterium]|nr:non-ribosomal peptide synthetase [Chloroflexota bacterium]
WPHDAFQHIIIHQTSKTTIRDAPREINSYFGAEICTPENVIDNIADRGNTATTTHMVAVMDNIRSNRIKSGDNAIFGVTGSGATIGTIIYTFDDLPERIRRIEAGEYKPEKVKSEQRKAVPLSPPMQRVRIESIGTIPEDTQVVRKTLDLVTSAAENCFAASAYKRDDIDLLMYCGVYRDDFLCEPAVASMVAGMLEINDTLDSQEEKKTFALDVMNGALGMLNACHTAIGIIKAKKVKNAMIVASEVENNQDGRSPELLDIEETGSAMILDEGDGRTGFGNFVFKYFTDYVDAYIAHSVTLNGKTCMHFEQDPRLQAYYLQCIQETIQELLSSEQLDLAQIKVILPPQISAEFITSLSDAMKVDRDKFVDVHARHDLFTSSLAYALQNVREQDLVKTGDIGLIIAVGSGIQVGCATYHF